MHQTDHIHDRTTQKISWMRIRIFQRARKVEWIDPFVRVQIDIQICPSDSIHEWLVLIFWIEYDDVRPEHKRAKDLELHGEGFSSSGFREDTHVRILR